MHRRDPIFWAATAIFVLSLVLVVVFGQQYLLLMAGSYLLRPTLHSLGFAKKLVDERQMQIQYQASNVAFAALVVGNAAMILYLMGKEDHSWEMVGGVLAAGLTVRALSQLLLVGDLALAGRRILIAVGLLAGLFAAMDAGFPGVLFAVLPGLVLVGLGLAAPKAPRAVAGIIVGIAVLFCLLMLPRAIRQPGGPNWGTYLTFGIILAPLLTAAVCLWRGASPDEAEIPVVIRT